MVEMGNRMNDITEFKRSIGRKPLAEILSEILWPEIFGRRDETSEEDHIRKLGKNTFIKEQDEEK